MNKFRKEEGLTLIELLIVIALVGIVAAIALPILLNVLGGAKTSSTGDTNAAVAKFVDDWSSAGYTIETGTVNGTPEIFAVGNAANDTATPDGVQIAEIADPNNVAQAEATADDLGTLAAYTA